jgi:ribonuclease D
MPRRSFQPAAVPERIVDHPALLAECLDHLRDCSEIAFDTEFVGEDTFRPELCLIQVATRQRLYLIDPLRCGDLQPFWQLFNDPQRQIVVHAGREEIRICWFASGLPPANLFDVQIAAAFVGYHYPIGYGSLVQELLSVRMSKSETLTDWRRRPLTDSQIRYAFDDVRYLLPLKTRLRRRLTELNRLHWAEEEFASSIRRAVTEEPSLERWRKVKGTGTLNPRQLAVLRELFHWRERYAERKNRPARTLLRDDLLVEIARRAQESSFDLEQLRGVPRTELLAIAEAISIAWALPREDLPSVAEREVDPPQVSHLANLLAVVLADFAAREHLAANLIANSADLKTLVRARLPQFRLPPDSPFFSGWRAAAVLPYLEAVLDGRVAIRVLDPNSPTPLVVKPWPEAQ